VILKFSVHPREDLDQPGLEERRQLLGLPDVRTWRDYYIEVEGDADPEAVDQLRAALGDRFTEEVRTGEPLVRGRMVHVAYKRGIVDNENDSLVALARLCGVRARAARVGQTYESRESVLATQVRLHCVNPNIEHLYEEEPGYETLGPIGASAPPEALDLLTMPNPELSRVGSTGGRNLDTNQMLKLQSIQRTLGLEAVTDVLIEAVDARWSDHCLHTTWRSLGNLLGRLVAASHRTMNPNVLSMYEDNAGVWAFYGDWAIAVKGETHSGPSAVSAYFGQLTKLGGVLRDILGTGLGADPIGSFEYTATGVPGCPSPVPGRPAPTQIALETIRAIKEYGNTFGVPMMSARMTFHPAFRAKPFALGGSIGLLPKLAAERGRPRSGDILMLIGGLTGNDGIHGASASSAGSEMDATTVQIGSPLEQVKFRQAIIDLRNAGCLRALTDVGGAGLNSAIGELGDPAGVWLNTALVPLKTGGLPTWRILLSESQERMVLAIVPAQLNTSRQILTRHDVRHTVIGRFTASRRYCVVHLPEMNEQRVAAAEVTALPSDRGTGFDVPYGLLDYRPPDLAVPSLAVEDKGPGAWPLLDESALAEIAPRIMSDPEVASQRYATAQYDTTVMGHTVYGPDAGCSHVPTSYWAGQPVSGSAAAVTFATAYEPCLFENHPVRATRQMFLQAVFKLVLAGVGMRDICLCDNFYTPHLDDTGFAWLVGMVDEVCDLMDACGTPVISGKDSSAGSVVTPEGVISVPPSVFFSTVGKVPDGETLRRNEWRRAGNLLVMIGPPTASTAGTVGGRVLDAGDATIDAVDVRSYRRFLEAVTAAQPHIKSARPIGPGGVLACLAIGALAGDLGADVDHFPGNAAWLLEEHRCGAVIEVPESSLPQLGSELQSRVIGHINGSAGSVTLADRDLATNGVGPWHHSWAETLS